MRETSYMKLICDMCGEEEIVKEEFGKVTGDGWMYVCGKMRDYCSACAGKINGFIQNQAEERRKHGTLVEVDEEAVDMENREDHGEVVERRADGSCTYADGAVSVRCAICGGEACVSDPCDLTEELGWMSFIGEKVLRICPDCDCVWTVRRFIGKETTGTLARMNKALERFMSSTQRN